MPDASERIAELQREVASNPASRQFYQLGELLRRDGRADEAVSVLRTGLVQHPRYVAAWVSLGRALIELTEAAAAGKVLQRAIELDTQNPVAWRLLGEARLMQGNRLGALSAMQKALELAPGDEMVTAAVDALAGETLPPGSFMGADIRGRGREAEPAARPAPAAVVREEPPAPAASIFLAPSPVVEKAAAEAVVAAPIPEEETVEAPAAAPVVEEAAVVEAPVIEAAPLEPPTPEEPAWAAPVELPVLEDPFLLESLPAAGMEDVFAVAALPVFDEALPFPAAAAVVEAAIVPQEEPVAETEAAEGTEEAVAEVEEPAAAVAEPAPVDAVAVVGEAEALPAPVVEEAEGGEGVWDFQPSIEPGLEPGEVPPSAEAIVEVGPPAMVPEKPAAAPARSELHIARPTVTLARLCIQQEDFPTAVAILEKIIDQQPANQEARDLLDLVRDMLEAGTVEELRPLTVRERKVAALQRWLASLTLGRERWLS